MLGLGLSGKQTIDIPDGPSGRDQHIIIPMDVMGNKGRTELTEFMLKRATVRRSTGAES